MSWLLDGFGTVQPEEIIWNGLAAFAILLVHRPGVNEARRDLWEAEHNNHHLRPALRRTAIAFAEARQFVERIFIGAQVFNLAVGTRSLFLLPSPDRSRSGTLFAVICLVGAESLIVYGSWRLARIRNRVRRVDLDDPDG